MIVSALLIAFLAALLLARTRFPGKTLVEGLLYIPLVLPPVAVGFLLLSTLGTRAGLGAWLYDHFGIRFIFSWTGAALASALITFPLQLRAIRQALEASDQGLIDAAKTLGAGPFDRSVNIIRSGYVARHSLLATDVRRQSRRVRCDHHFRLEYSRRDADLAARDLRRASTSGRRCGGRALVGPLDRSCIDLRLARQCHGTAAQPMSVAVSIVARRGTFALDVNFDIAKSGVTALFGPSGAGKTSIVNAIAGLMKPSAGRIVINGHIKPDRES